MASNYIYRFISDAFELLPQKDRNRFAETWKGYEQIFGDCSIRTIELDLGVSIKTVPTFNCSRWNRYVFDDTTQLDIPAVYTSNQDLSVSINLTNNYLIKIRVDGVQTAEVDLRGVNPASTKIDEIKSKINAAFGFALASGIFENTIVQLTSATVGVDSSIEFLVPSNPTKSAAERVFGIDEESLPVKYPKYPWSFALPSNSFSYGSEFLEIVQIPTMQNAVREETVTKVLKENTDYAIERTSQTISFLVKPAEVLWAKNTYLNYETPYNNFGYLLDYYSMNDEKYANSLRGLWFAFWTGPTPENIRRSLYLLFGLPTSSNDGTITNVTATEITATYVNGQTETWEIPTGLAAIVAVGDTIDRFQPLVEGIDVFDKISSPGFIEREIGRAGVQRFLTEKASRGFGDTDETKALRLMEENTFLPQINVEAFIDPNISMSNIKTFLRNIQPKHKTFLFQIIVGVFRDRMKLTDPLALHFTFDVTPNIDYNPWMEAEESVLTDGETIDNPGLVMDSEVIKSRDEGQVTVYDHGIQIDSFTL